MLEHHIRPIYQRALLDPLACTLANSAITPNQITVSALVVGLLIPLSLCLGSPVVALLMLGLSGVLDSLDGTLARLCQQNTPFGTVLDIVCDRGVEFAVIVGLYYVQPDVRAGYCLWMLGATLLCVTSFLVVGIFSDNQSQKGFHYSPGIIERLEAFVIFALMIALPGSFVVLAIVYTLLVLLTTLIRLVEFSRSAYARGVVQNDP